MIHQKLKPKEEEIEIVETDKTMNPLDSKMMMGAGEAIEIEKVKTIEISREEIKTIKTTKEVIEAEEAIGGVEEIEIMVVAETENKEEMEEIEIMEKGDTMIEIVMETEVAFEVVEVAMVRIEGMIEVIVAIGEVSIVIEIIITTIDLIEMGEVVHLLFTMLNRYLQSNLNKKRRNKFIKFCQEGENLGHRVAFTSLDANFSCL